MNRSGSTSRHVDAPADEVFDVITDLAQLPAWNRRLTGVVAVPPRLEAGAEWVVRVHLLGRRFDSRSVVLEYDPRCRRFAHRSKPDDDNPTATVWHWQVDPEGDGSRVTMRWELRPVTFVRRWVAAPIRARQIPRRDAPESLAALAQRCEATSSPNPTEPKGAIS